jgi:hypothetical protein
MYGGDAAGVHPLTSDEAAAWLAGVRGHPHAWVVEYDGRCIGQSRLDDLDAEHGHAQYAVGLQVRVCSVRDWDEKQRGWCSGTPSERSALHRVGLRVLAVNERAVRCYTSCGFRVEAANARRPGSTAHWHDDLIMGVLAHEFAG